MGIQSSGFNPAIVEQRYEQYISGFDRLRLQILYGRRFFSLGYYRDRPWSRRRALQILMLPLMALPFRMERIQFGKALSPRNLRGIVRQYLYLRKAILNFVLRPPPTISTIF